MKTDSSLAAPKSDEGGLAAAKSDEGGSFVLGPLPFVQGWKLDVGSSTFGCRPRAKRASWCVEPGCNIPLNQKSKVKNAPSITPYSGIRHSSFLRSLGPSDLGFTPPGAYRRLSAVIPGSDRRLSAANAETGLIVRSEQQLSEEQRAQITAALVNRKRGAGCADRSVLLWGATEVVRPQLSSADLQFLENRKFSRAEICAAFGVPEEIITGTDHAKYDVMRGARLNFIENRILPLCARLEAEENATTIPALLRSYSSSIPSSEASLRTPHSALRTPIGWFDIDSLPIMQEARRSRLATAKTGFDMGIPFNELNRVLDLGFRPQPWGDTGFLPANLQKLEAPTPVPLTAPAAQLSVSAPQSGQQSKIESHSSQIPTSPPSPKLVEAAQRLHDVLCFPKPPQ